MNAEKRTLGRGLSSLIPAAGRTDIGTAGITHDTVSEVPVDQIKPNPHQPRQQFDSASLEDLINSIKVHGILQPLIVLPVRGGYELIAGERRLRAAKVLGLKRVPVVVRSATDQQKLEFAIVENVQRQNLTPIERAYSYRSLVDEFNMTQEQVAKKVSQSRAAVANTLRLLALPAHMQQSLLNGRITEGHAKALLSVPDEQKRERLFREITREQLTVRGTESRAQSVSVRQHRRQVKGDPNLKSKEDLLQESLGTKVAVRRSGRGGTITVYYYSDEELTGIMKKIIG
ncbi:MAG: ParB/RepB/Spo0J family partition protein [Patescibacteria group bacterium]